MDDTDIPEVYYRTISVHYAPRLDDLEMPIRGSGHCEIHTVALTVVKRTPKGVWVNKYGKCSQVHIDQLMQNWKEYKGTCTFVRHSSRKKYAHPTISESVEAFIARTDKMISIFSARIADAEKELEIARSALANLTGNRDARTEAVAAAIGSFKNQYRIIG